MSIAICAVNLGIIRVHITGMVLLVTVAVRCLSRSLITACDGKCHILSIKFSMISNFVREARCLDA